MQAIEDTLEVYNEDPKPFIWAKSADDILESLKSDCEWITDTGHQGRTLKTTLVW